MAKCFILIVRQRLCCATMAGLQAFMTTAISEQSALKTRNYKLHHPDTPRRCGFLPFLLQGRRGLLFATCRRSGQTRWRGDGHEFHEASRHDARLASSPNSGPSVWKIGQNNDLLTRFNCKLGLVVGVALEIVLDASSGPGACTRLVPGRGSIFVRLRLGSAFFPSHRRGPGC